MLLPLNTDGRILPKSLLLKRLFGILILLLVLIALPSYSFAEEVIVETRTEKLNDIEQKLGDIANRRKALQKQLSDKTLPEEEKEELTQRLQTLTNQNRDFNILFEQTVLGGIDLSIFEEVESDLLKDPLNYNWQKEVLEILQPFFAQMQRVTEKARNKDLLIENEKLLTSRLTLAETGLAALQNLDKSELNKNALKSLAKIEEDWLDRIKSLEHQKSIVELKLDDLTDNRNFFVRVTDNFWGFLKNEGFAIIIAIGASFGFYYLFNLLILRYAHYQQKNRKRALNFKWRFILLTLQAIKALLSLAIFLMILHTTGNIILFGIMLLILFIAVLSFRGNIPQYLQKLRVFLNLGQAREGERIIYNDIPWEISKISLSNVYLTNPLLDNGELHVTIELIDKLYSRETITDELWFPSRKGDFLLLPDKRIVQVIRQTPEAVYLNHDGATIVMGTAEFYKLKFSNLSRGYSLILNFTLEDHYENRLSLTNIKDSIITGIHKIVKTEDESLYQAIRNISVTVRQLLTADTTSYQVIVEMSPNSAKSYLTIKALLNNAIIEISREHDWRILLTENI